MSNRESVQGSAAGSHALRVLRFFQNRGVDSKALCREVGISPESLATPGARIPYALLATLGERGNAVLKDENFGLHLAQDIPEVFTFDAGALMLMASATIRDGITRVVRFQRYWGDGERLRVLHIPGGLCARYVFSLAESTRHAHECMMAEFFLGMRHLSGAEVVPRVLRFSHAAPSKLEEHHALFQCPIEFDAPHTETELDDATLELSLKNANEAFCMIFQEQVARAVDALPAQKGPMEEVRAIARATLAGGNCELAATAKVLRMSPRTLQRRLAEHGTNFAELVDSVRRELALEYLAKQLTSNEIAFLLGYTEVSAFHHAFKRWTGRTPEQARLPTH